MQTRITRVASLDTQPLQFTVVRLQRLTLQSQFHSVYVQSLICFAEYFYFLLVIIDLETCRP